MPTPRATILLLFAALAPAARGAEPAPYPREVLTGYRTPAQAIRADPAAFQTAAEAAAFVPGFVGVEVGSADGRAVLADVAPGSPAATAGLKPGDAVLDWDGRPITSAAVLRDALRGTPADAVVPATIGRDGKHTAVTVRPRPASRPLSETAAGRVVIGVQTAPPRADGSVEVTAVTPGGGADRAGVKVGDILLRVGATALTAQSQLRDLLNGRTAGEEIALALRRGKEEIEVRAALQAEAPPANRAGGWDDRLPRAWTKPTYRVAVLGIEYPDVRHDPKITDAAWDAALFSVGRYADKSPTGQPVHGSMADYFRTISHGRFVPEGKFLGWVPASRKREEYSSGFGTSSREKTSLLTETLDAYLDRAGADGLDGYDGVFFVYAGARVATTRGSLYWPHRATVRHGGKAWPYFIVPEGGPRMTDISLFAHEFGHMLGMPDLYARPEVPGMEGVGPWCAMSQQNGGGRPQWFSAWCRAQLGWLDPVMIDPRVKQKIVLAPVGRGPGECVKIPVRADGSEYLLLENRRREGFDADLPGEGLLIWRVVPGSGVQRVYLEEAHGVTAAAGPRVHLGAVPFPSPSNDSFTPATTPSSRSRLGGGLDVYITAVRRLPDGRVTFHVGYEYQ